MTIPLLALDPALASLHAELGISADYAATRGLEIQPEAAQNELVAIATEPTEIRLIAPAADAWRAMRAAAARDGITLLPISGFRSVAYQADLIRRKLARGQAIDDILRVNTAPGFSQHHTGRAVDLTSPGDAPLTEAFAETSAYAWLTWRAAQYGFGLSYPSRHWSGITFEPWHWYWQD